MILKQVIRFSKTTFLLLRKVSLSENQMIYLKIFLIMIRSNQIFLPNQTFLPNLVYLMISLAVTFQVVAVRAVRAVKHPMKNTVRIEEELAHLLAL